MGCGLLWLSLLPTDAQIMAPTPRADGIRPSIELSVLPEACVVRHLLEPLQLGRSATSALISSSSRVHRSSSVAACRRDQTPIDQMLPKLAVRSSAGSAPARSAPLLTGSDADGPDGRRSSPSGICWIRSSSVAGAAVPASRAWTLEKCDPRRLRGGTGPDDGGRPDEDGNRQPRHRPADPSRGPGLGPPAQRSRALW